MKKNVNLVSVLAVGLALLAPPETNAQVLKGLGRKIEKKVERQVNSRVERRIDKAINKGMDKVEGAAEDAIEGDKNVKANGENATDSTQGAIRIPTGANVTIAGTYDFTLGVAYSIQSGRDNPLETTMWFGDGDYIGISTSTENNMFMIMQNENIITFMEKEKNYMVIGSGMMKGIMNAAAKETQEDSGADNISITQIGTERFLDYQCEVYEVKSPEYTSKIWVTQDLGTETGDFMKAFSTLVKEDMGRLGDMQHGILLKMEGMSGNDSEVITMEATAVHKQGLQFDTSQYTRSGL